MQRMPNRARTPNRGSIVASCWAAAATLAALALTACGTSPSAQSSSRPATNGSAQAQSQAPLSCEQLQSGPQQAGTARFTNVSQNGKVTFQQVFTGVIKSIPGGSDAWLVVRPILGSSFWPQSGPLNILPTGQFTQAAYIGQSATDNVGDLFELMIVSACPDASRSFQDFSKVRNATGMPSLPDGTRVLASISVNRKQG